MADKSTLRHMQSTLKYYADPSDGSEPTPVVIGQGSTVTNERKVKKTPVIVNDIRGREDSFTLDIYGFQLVR